ncbi:hypothetical protein GN244_ATG19722 [Phytophthora infestans]|uniref:Uncharacterized protein n=1 Tax=Phytophthora infestans TaxID=4787 RepID=A0A833SL37_PHYIN|nr:hypothetical protein GN244_ATG19722 [Phytophthora infestans]
MKLAIILGVKVDQIDFKQHLDRSKDYCILNMGTPQIGGTHWLALKYRILDLDTGGQYSDLWLYYLQHNQLDKFFKLFNDQSP